MAWNGFASAVEDCPILHIPDWMLVQHFWSGLRKGDAMWLNALSEGSFVPSTASGIIDGIRCRLVEGILDTSRLKRVKRS